MEKGDLFFLGDQQPPKTHYPPAEVVAGGILCDYQRLSPQSELINRHNHSSNQCNSSCQQIHQRKSEDRYVYLLVHIHRYAEVAYSLEREKFTSLQEREEWYAKTVYPVA